MAGWDDKSPGYGPNRTQAQRRMGVTAPGSATDDQRRDDAEPEKGSAVGRHAASISPLHEHGRAAYFSAEGMMAHTVLVPLGTGAPRDAY